MSAILLALGTALGYGVANYLAPVLGRRMPLATVLLGGQVAGLVVSLLLTIGGDVGMGPSGLGWALAAGVCNAVALACFYRAGQIGDLSVVSPIASAGAIVPVLVGLLTGDRPGVLQIVGMPLVLAGIVTASDDRGPSPEIRPSTPRGHAASVGRCSPDCCSAGS